MNGIKLQGWIDSFDETVLRSTAIQVIYKRAISTIIPGRTSGKRRMTLWTSRRPERAGTEDMLHLQLNEAHIPWFSDIRNLMQTTPTQMRR